MALEKRLDAHEKANPRPAILRQDGSEVPEGIAVANLVIPGGLAELPIHPEAQAELEASTPSQDIQPPPKLGRLQLEDSAS